MRMFVAVSVLVVLAAAVGAEPRVFQGSGLLQTGMDACGDDIERFCADVPPGESRIGRCLHEHFTKLSRPCRRFARHGGQGHEMESLLEIDRSYYPPEE